MRALVFNGSLAVRDVAVPEPSGNEALIRVRLAGICNTDLEITRGYSGFTGVLGHEFVGEVVSGPDPGWIGQRVCGEINAACETCDRCRAGNYGHCSRRTVLGIAGRNGAFADYLALPLRNLHPIPNVVDDESAVFVEPLAAAFQILEQIEVRPSDRVVVFGDGKLGNLCAQVLALTGARLTVGGRHDSKLSLLKDLGIDGAPAEHIPPGEADIVVDATGTPAGFETAIAALRPRGALVLKSTTAGGAHLNLAPVVVQEITIIGSRCGPFPRAIEALTHGRVQVKPLIHACRPLSQGIAAMEEAGRRGLLKVLLDPAE